MNDPSGSAKRTEYPVAADEDGQRIDNLLMKLDRARPRSEIYRLLRTGQVRLNGRRIAPSERVHTGDRVRLPPFFGRPPRPPPKLDTSWLEERILDEDEDCLVLDKPAGLAVHGGSGIGLGVIDLVHALRPEAPLIAPAHRLDRETSGCLLLGKNRLALRQLQESFLTGRVVKTYLALCVGRWPENLTLLDTPLSKRPGEDDEPRMRSARTHVHVLRSFSEATLLELRLETGRMHQIRRHTAEQGHPILGDRRYGSPKDNRTFARAGLKRLFLHAASLEFPHPKGEGTIAVRSPLPPDLESMLKNLR